MTQTIEPIVKEKYGAVASSALSNTHAGVQAVAEAFGYSRMVKIMRRVNMPVISVFFWLIYRYDYGRLWRFEQGVLAS